MGGRWKGKKGRALDTACWLLFWFIIVNLTMVWAAGVYCTNPLLGCR